MRLLSLAAVLALVPAIAVARPKRNRDKKAPSAPVGKTAPACGAKMLPLVAGNTWTYEAVSTAEVPTDQIKRLSPAQPKSIVVTVKSVEPKDGETVATLEEKVTIDRTKEPTKPNLEEYSYTSTITCTDKKFDISPNSFFFAGEPGGYLGLEIDKLDRKGTSWQLTKGSIGDKEWREDVVMHWVRKPAEGSAAKLGSGKVELERRFTPQEPEAINTKKGVYKAEKLGLITTGRVTLEQGSPAAKPMELPAGWVSQLWIASDVGIVQTLDSYAHKYQLTELTLQ